MTMMKNFALLTLALVLTAGFAVVAQAAGEIKEIKKADKIRIGVFSDKPPFGYVDENGEHQGYDIYLARRLAKDLLGDENKVEFVLVEAASRMEVLESNKVDIVLANFTVTPERAQKVDFAKPYMKVALGVVSPENARVTDVTQLRGQKLIVNKGTTADIYFSRNHPEITLIKYDQNTEAFNALRDGRGAALAHDNTLIFAWIAENPSFVAGIDFLGNLDAIAPAVKKGNGELLDWLNAELAALGKENFFRQAYEATLKPIYGDAVDPETVIIEDGETR